IKQVDRPSGNECTFSSVTEVSETEATQHTMSVACKKGLRSPIYQKITNIEVNGVIHKRDLRSERNVL
ncbi:hypothetical protein, partial [Bradyrhizobium diazoefficiens]